MVTPTAVPVTKFPRRQLPHRGAQARESFQTPEDITEQHLLIAQAAEEFANKEVVPKIEKKER